MRATGQAAEAAAVVEVVRPEAPVRAVRGTGWPTVVLDRCTGELHRDRACAEAVARVDEGFVWRPEWRRATPWDEQMDGARLLDHVGGWHVELHLTERDDLTRCRHCWYGAGQAAVRWLARRPNPVQPTRSSGWRDA